MGDLASSFEQTIRASNLTRPVDAALVETGRQIAGQIDFAVENLSGQDLTKALYLAPHLVNILRELLATPASRHAAGLVEEGSTVSKLATVRAMAKSKAS